MMIPVILSGGSGTRLWPLSREAFPKQFLALLGEHSLFQETLRRLRAIPEYGPPILVCNHQHRFLAAEQLRVLNISDATILLEPVGRNTAPATACAAFTALNNDPDAILLVLPADHLVRDVSALHRALNVGMLAAQKGHMVTFGIVPEKPETGFGYIQRGEAHALSSALHEAEEHATPPPSDTETPAIAPQDHTAFAVKAFVEKPDLKTAQAYVDAGDYYWNSGMFLFRADRFLQELRRLAPLMFDACQHAVARATPSFDFVSLDATAFSACPKDSIDYAVMEKTTASVVVPLQAGWSDVGAWSALWEESHKDSDGNVLVGDVLVQNVKNSLVRSENRLVAAIGLDNHVIIETSDAVFVSHKDHAQETKTIVKRLQAMGRNEAGAHRKIYRPWGTYESIDHAQRFQVKRITVNPGAKLSLQMHHHRAEHWIVVKGTARVTKEEETFLLSEDQSTYIPLGITHRLENPGSIPLELIEVQSGSYLGEDDIVRFEDKYGR